MLILYRAANGQFAWKLHATNHRGLTAPGETFTDRRGALRNFERVCDLLGVTKKRRREMIDGARVEW